VATTGFLLRCHHRRLLLLLQHAVGSLPPARAVADAFEERGDARMPCVLPPLMERILSVHSGEREAKMLLPPAVRLSLIIIIIIIIIQNYIRAPH
jgi:hypothetical protein